MKTKIYKWIIIMGSILLFPFNSNSVTTVRTDRVWEYWGWAGQTSILYIHYVDFDDSTPLEFEGNTYLRSRIFKSVKCKNIEHILQNNSSIFKLELLNTEERDYTLAYMREENGKVYTLLEDGSWDDGEYITHPREWLVYDWNIEDDSTWTYYPQWMCDDYCIPDVPYNTYHVKYLDPVVIENEMCKVMFLKNYLDIKFIEGIGCDRNGTLCFPFFDDISGYPDNTIYPNMESHLKGVYNSNGDKIYSDDEIYFELISGIDDTIKVKIILESQTFDLFGNQIANPLPGSIYIRDGKKFIAK